jgi:hypothetical protein
LRRANQGRNPRRSLLNGWASPGFARSSPLTDPRARAPAIRAYYAGERIVMGPSGEATGHDERLVDQPREHVRDLAHGGGSTSRRGTAG